jgi:hypothetical protein
MGKQDRCIASKIDISVISNLLYLRNKIGGCETNVNLSSKIFDHRDESNPKIPISIVRCVGLRTSFSQDTS